MGYLESLTMNSLEVVKFKSKRSAKKQIFLISNDDCITVKKEQGNSKTVNELIIDNINVNQTGKVLIDNGKLLTVQKGHPYFFPNCKTDDSKQKVNLQYKLLTLNKNTKSPPNRSKCKKSNDKAKTANDTEALHAASEDKSENQQPTFK